VHLDGDKQMHDKSVCEEGVYDRAVKAIAEAKKRGFSRQHQLHAVQRCQAGQVAAFFDQAKSIGIDGITGLARLCL